MSGTAVRFDAPARTWLEALPLGNGRLGAMVFGDPWTERIALNDSTLWSGSPGREDADAVAAAVAHRALRDSRAAVLDRRFADATAAVQQLQSSYSQTFLPLGDLRLEVALADGSRPPVRGYRRELDLAAGVHRTVFDVEGKGTVQWEVCLSHPDGVLQLHLTSDIPLAVRARWETPLHALDREADGHLGSAATWCVRAPGDVPPPHEDDLEIEWSGESISAAVVADWLHDGESIGTIEDGAQSVRTLTLCLAVETTFAGFGRRPGPDVEPAVESARERVVGALGVGRRSIVDRHCRDHEALFGRVGLTLCTSDGTMIDEKLFHYGRYLLIAASRSGGAPATLQGLWNERMRPPWSSNYTININTQMNYWAAGPAALAETAEPLLALLEALMSRGSKTAARLYGARGWVAHHNTDIWAYTSQVGRGSANPSWACWPFGGVWLTLTIVELIRFGADDLAHRAYPVVAGAMRFVLDWMIEIDGIATTAPSTSPENSFRTAAGDFAVGRSSTSDLALATELAVALVEIAELVKREDDDVVSDARRLLDRIPPIRPGAGGLIPEWADDDPQTEPHHRHISHLLGLYPGTTLRGDEARSAAAASLDARGDESTGWSLVWKIAARARLRDRRAVGRLLELVFRDAPEEDAAVQRGGLYPNLFAAHPPFQIDGNLGYVAAVCECLVQSHDGSVELLPALPERWAEGEVSGLIARPGISVTVSWDERGLRAATLTPLTAAAKRVVSVRLGDTHLAVNLTLGAAELRRKDFDPKGVR